MRIVTLLAPLLALTLVAPLASAHHCHTNENYVTEGDYYVIYEVDPEGGFSLWILAESNGIPGPQDGSEAYDVHPDDAHGGCKPDALFF